MRRQSLAIGISWTGEIVAVTNLSRVAQAAGLTRDKVIGTQLWAWAPDPSVLQSKLRDALFSGHDQEFDTVSTVNGTKEHWRGRLVRCREPAAVVAQFQEAPTAKPLSHSDCDLIQRLCDDMSIGEIASELGTLPNTISGRLQRLRERFGVKTNTGLVAECIRLGLS